MHSSRRPSLLLAPPLAVTLLVAIVAALLASADAPAEAVPTRTDDEAAAERHLLEAHNRSRADASRAALRRAPDLTEVARAWSDEMARTATLTHNPAVSGQICCWTAWGENIAWAGPVEAMGGWQPTADRIMRGWLDSPKHRDNLLSATFDEVGIGTAVADDGRMYATAVFRRSDGTSAPSTQPTPSVRDIDAACPPDDTPGAGFTDVPAGQTRAVDCLAWWDVTQGMSATRYAPLAGVTRGQLATFLANAIEHSGRQLPAATSRFSDLAGSAHREAIGKLAAAEVIGGFPDGSFRPDVVVERAQMATMMVRAAEYRNGTRLRAPSRDWFLDDSGTHQRAINQVAEAGWTAGSGNGYFAASAALERGHLALFVSRWLDTMVAEHGADRPA